jgi:hypothetical protein
MQLRGLQIFEVLARDVGRQLERERRLCRRVNPARAIGPMIAAGKFTDWWVYATALSSAP